ncbi:hypothetical protein [Nocardia gamkensis]|uniref:hypothetical protein n=1 Tax=Nocardia gamkensis TaxID=352869 RepID=UPI0037C7A93C
MKRIGAGAETAEECVDEGADLGRVEGFSGEYHPEMHWKEQHFEGIDISTATQ